MTAVRLDRRGGARQVGIAESPTGMGSSRALHRHTAPVLGAGLAVGAALLAGLFFVSLSVGAADIALSTAWAALTGPGESVEHLTVRTLRLPRALIALAVGGSLAVAGALMQGVARNPLAEPGILGLNAGAALAVVAGAFMFGVSSPGGAAVLAMVGAGATAVVVYLLGSLGREGLTSLRLVLAGAAMAALFGSLTTGFLLLDEQTLDQVRFWLAGSVAGRDLSLLTSTLPYLAGGLALAFALGRPITTLSLGEDVARGLGQRTLRVHILAALAVTLLAGGSVALAGPIAFVGLVVPNVVRSLVGLDFRWLLPYSAIGGSMLLLLADMAARVVARPMEVPVGVMTAVIGAPVLIHIARRGRAA